MTAAHARSTKHVPAHRVPANLFVVDSKGVARRGVTATVRDTVASAAGATSEVIAASTSSHWLVQLFETETQRRNRLAAELVGALFGAVASVVRRDK